MSDLPGGWTMPDDGPAGPLPGSLLTGSPVLSSYDEPARRAVRGVIPLRPLGVGEVLDGAVAVIRAVPRPVFAFSAGVAVVTALLDLLVTLTLLGPLTSTTASEVDSSDPFAVYTGSVLVGTGLTLLISVISAAVLAGIVTAVVGRALFGTPTSLGEAWSQVRPRLPRLLLLSLVVGLAVYGAFFGSIAVLALLALAGPGGVLLGVLLLFLGSAAAVWLYIRWSLAPAVLVLERQGVRASLKRSGVLVARSWWRIIGVLLLALVIALFVSLVVQLPFQLLGYSPFDGLSADYELTTTQAVIGAVSGAFASTVVAPFSAGVRSLLYVDRRMRAEGLDVALVAASTDRRG